MAVRQERSVNLRIHVSVLVTLHYPLRQAKSESEVEIACAGSGWLTTSDTLGQLSRQILVQVALYPCPCRIHIYRPEVIHSRLVEDQE